MDYKTLEMLEFPQVKQILAGFTSFSASRELALGLEPVASYEEATKLLRQSSEARRLLTKEPSFSIGGVLDIRELVRMAARDKVLEPLNLIEIQQTLNALRVLRGRLKSVSDEFPLLWNIAENMVELGELEKDIGRCITPGGDLLDDASPELANVRSRIREVRRHLQERLEAIMRTPKGNKITQEPLITEREGRYVIPVKIEFRKEIKGIIHDVSNTGVTVFIEPWATVEMGNELRELATEEKREVDRILGGLSAEVGANETEICRSIELAAQLDLALAKARYARSAHAAEPVLTSFDETGTDSAPRLLRLLEARHPLLGEKAVPLSVEIGRDFSVLVITGPNTGGKTVALKTIGLLSLMAHSGMPIPASPETRIPFFDGVFADIGDEQSIEQTLSTFSWHISNILRIINNATDRSLVLLDELGTSTDPEEGSALARSILLQFLSRGILTAATTHFSELKAFAHNTPGLQNASLDFDPVTLAPTYHLTVGTPGGSNALATAARLGLPLEIIDTARGMLSKGTQELEALLTSVMEEKQKLQALRSELEKEKAGAAQKSTELEKELQRLKDSEKQVVREQRERLDRVVIELQKEIQQAVSELRREKSKERVEQARKAVATVREKLKEEIWQPPSSTPETEEATIRAGDTVWLKEASVQAQVLSISEETQQVEVQAGQVRMKLGLDSVEKVAPAAAKPGIDFRPIKKPTVAARRVSLELDLRGKHVEEIELLLDSYLNDASLSNLREVRIIHGIGTGVARRVVRELLSAHPLVKSFRSGLPNEGSDGATVVSL